MALYRLSSAKRPEIDSEGFSSGTLVKITDTSADESQFGRSQFKFILSVVAQKGNPIDITFWTGDVVSRLSWDFHKSKAKKQYTKLALLLLSLDLLTEEDIENRDEQKLEKAITELKLLKGKILRFKLKKKSYGNGSKPVPDMASFSIVADPSEWVPVNRKASESIARIDTFAEQIQDSRYLIIHQRDKLLEDWRIRITGKEDALDLHYCYLATTASRNKIKVGYSDNPPKRIQYLNQGKRGNLNVKLVAFFKGGYELESAIKHRFREYKCNKPHCSMGNDWFEGNKETLTFIDDFEFHLKFRNKQRP